VVWQPSLLLQVPSSPTCPTPTNSKRCTSILNVVHQYHIKLAL
jgi:hypothetical protein